MPTVSLFLVKKSLYLKLMYSTKLVTLNSARNSKILNKKCSYYPA